MTLSVWTLIERQRCKNMIDIEDCGLDGDPDDVAHIRSVNRLLNRIAAHHVVPMKKDLCALKKQVTDHITEENIVMAEITGGLKVLKWIGVLALFALAAQGYTIAKLVLEMVK